MADSWWVCECEATRCHVVKMMYVQIERHRACVIRRCYAADECNVAAHYRAAIFVAGTILDPQWNNARGRHHCRLAKFAKERPRTMRQTCNNEPDASRTVDRTVQWFDSEHGDAYYLKHRATRCVVLTIDTELKCNPPGSGSRRLANSECTIQDSSWHVNITKAAVRHCTAPLLLRAS